MKLSTQNTLLLWFSALSSLVAVFFTIELILYFLNSYIPPIAEIPAEDNSSFFTLFTQKTYIYRIVSLCIFSLYVPIVGFTIYVTFEKTKSPEILYYIAMLIGFFAQSIALCIPLFPNQSEYSLFFNSVSSVSFFGQIQILLSILFQGILVSQEEARDSDKFLGIISVTALIFAVIIPIDMTRIAFEYAPTYGFESLFQIIRIVFIIIVFGSMVLSPTSKKNKDYRNASIGFFGLCMGYAIIMQSTILIIFVIGLLALVIGTVFFLRKLHSFYMWK